MMVGGISALLQALHPLALAGVWDHSNFREDLLGRLRRTGQFISATTFGSHADAERLIERVRRIHLSVTGTAPDGRAYAAYDPELRPGCTSPRSAVSSSHLRYRDPDLSAADQDRYYAEVALIAERLGAEGVPRSRAEVETYLERLRPQLQIDARALEILDTAHRSGAEPTAAAVRHADATCRYRTAAGMGLSNVRPTAERHPSRADSQRVRRTAPVLRCGAQCLGAPRARRHGPATTLAAAVAPHFLLDCAPLFRAARMPSPDQALRAAFDRRRPLQPTSCTSRAPIATACSMAARKVLPA